MIRQKGKDILPKMEWITQKLNLMDNKIENLISRITMLEASVKERPERNLKQMIQEIMETIKKVREAASNINKLSETSSMAISFLNKIASHSSKLIEEQGKLNEILMRIEEERKEIEKKLEKSIKAEAYEETLQMIMEAIKEIDKIKDNINEKHSALITLYNETVKSISTIRDIEYKALEALSQLASKANDITREIKQIAKIEEEIRRSYAEKILDIREREHQLKLWSNDILLKQEKINEKESALKVMEEKLSKKERELIQREKMLLDMISKLNVKIKEYENLLRSVNSRILYLEQLEIRGEELERKIKELKKEKEELQREKDKMIRENEALKTRVETLKVQIEKLNQILSRSRVKILLATPPTAST